MCYFCAPGRELSVDSYDSHATRRDPPASEFNGGSGPGRTELIAQRFDATENRYEFSGDQDIDATLIGSRWSLTNLTFSFPTSGAVYAGQGYGAGEEPDGFIILNAAQQTAARYALSLISSYVNLTLTEITETATTHANFRLSQTSQTDDIPSAEANFPSSKGRAGDVWFGTSGQPFYSTPAVGNWGHATMMHELGHAFGLKHGHQDASKVDLSVAEGGLLDAPRAGGPRFGSVANRLEVDGQDWSLMTYRPNPAGDPKDDSIDGVNQPQTYMQHDIAALQYLYGANFSFNAGATVYSWSATTGQSFVNGVGQTAPTSNTILRTVWDGDGVDTYDLSNYSTAVDVNLEPGAFSIFSFDQLASQKIENGDFAMSQGNVANARLFQGDVRSLIENAIGGSANDRLTGNQADNALVGGAGNDRMIGGAGDDTLFGGFARIGQTGGGVGPVFGSGQITPTTTHTNFATAVDVSKQFSLAENRNIESSTEVPHVTIDARGSGFGNNYYKITVNVPFGVNLLTIDFDSIGVSGAFDMGVGLYDAFGNLLFFVDDSATVDAGSPARNPGNPSSDTTDPFLQFPFNARGTYYIGVFAFDNATNDFAPSISVDQRYRMHVSVFDETVAEEILTGDILSGGDGFDTADYSNATEGVAVDLAAATQAAAGGANGDVLTGIEGVAGSAFVDRLTAAAAGGSLAGAAGDDVLTGRGGGDTLDGGAGADDMRGGTGDDTYVVDNLRDVVEDGLNAGFDIVRSFITYTLGANIETLALSGAGAINGRGNAFANLIVGNANNNQLAGGGGADTLRGGLGDDRYTVTATGVTVTEAANGGIDTVVSSISLTLGANVEKLILAGTATLNASGNALANALSGNSAANLLNGNAGADTLAGGRGDDRYIVDSVRDVVTEAANGGTDWVMSSATHTLGLNVEKLTLTGTEAVNGTGNALANTLTGNTGANLLNGAVGADTMVGGLGADRYVVDNVRDVVTELANGGTDAVLSAATHTLALNVEKLTLTGRAAANGFGNATANTIVGNAASNVLDGGLGLDTLSGGAGTDSFLFRTRPIGSNVDTITDFSVVDDQIRLDNALFLGLSGGVLAANAFAKGTANVASDPFDRVIYNVASGSLFFDRDGTGSAYAAVRFAILDDDLATMSSRDFFVV